MDSERKMTCSQVNRYDIVDYLAAIGIQPAKISRQDFWYHSPLRVESTPSFKVNRKINKWYDFGEGRGGSLIDFAILYHKCTIKEFFAILSGHPSCHKPAHYANTIQGSGDRESKISIIDIRPLYHAALIGYLSQRRIPIAIADHYCREVHFTLNGKRQFAIGFENDAGGYELRNSLYKLSSTPKAPTTLRNGKGRTLAMFEGFMDFLSYRTIMPENKPDEDILVLNSLSFFQVPEKTCYLYLDNDYAGRNAVLMAMAARVKVTDCSFLYRHHKDLNDFLCHFGNVPPG